METEKINLYFLTGFLGSGKTTILRQILERLKEEKVGIIQNEFGKLGIDRTILRTDNIKMVEINRGSIFCSCLKLSFVEALSTMATQEIRYLFVESSGLGDPSNVEEILEAVKILAGDRYYFRGTICLVDAVNFMEQLGDLETVYRQLKHCHLAVITKTDLATEQQIEKVKEKMREINPICKVELSAKGNLNFAFLEENLIEYQWAEQEDTTNKEENKPKTIFLNCGEEIEKGKLIDFLQQIAGDVYRSKGFFKIKGIGWSQVDLVGTRVDIQPCEEKEQSQLVFISKIGPAIIKKIFAVWDNTIGIKMELKN